MTSETTPSPRLRPAPPVLEAYNAYTPPFGDVVPIVETLLDAVPRDYVRQIQSVMLTNYAALSRPDRRRRIWSRGRKVTALHSLGGYMPAWRGQKPWIRLMVDRIFDPGYGFLLRLRFFRTMLLAATLYHEIGHHLHFTTFPDSRDREVAADEWSKKLRRRFWRRRYWYMPPPVLMGALLHPLRYLAWAWYLLKRRRERIVRAP